MHLTRTDLHLERDAVPADNRCVQGAVHIGLRRRNIVLEPSRHRVKHVVNHAERRIAFQLCFYDDAERVKIVDFVKALVLVVHFPVDAVDALDSALQRKMNMIFRKLLRYLLPRLFQKIPVQAVFPLDIV